MKNDNITFSTGEEFRQFMCERSNMMMGGMKCPDALDVICITSKEQELEKDRLLERIEKKCYIDFTFANMAEPHKLCNGHEKFEIETDAEERERTRLINKIREDFLNETGGVFINMEEHKANVYKVHECIKKCKESMKKPKVNPRCKNEKPTMTKEDKSNSKNNDKSSPM